MIREAIIVGRKKGPDALRKINPPRDAAGSLRRHDGGDLIQ